MRTLFSRNTIDFLIENRIQNSKTWFEEHRTQYNEFVLAPLVSITEDLSSVILDIDDKLMCSPKAGGSISRIWRDTRFSKDKSLYRDSMWCSFIREKGVGLPEFFFVISAEGFLYGSGYYSANATSMGSIRNLILSDDKDFQTALFTSENQNLFKLEGDMYKKSRYPDSDDRKRNWLERKTICFIHENNDFELLFSNDLSSAIAEGFKILAPVYNFLIKAEELIRK